MLSILATYGRSRSFTSSNSVCDTTRQAYVNNARCDDASSATPPAISFNDCVIAIQSTQSLPFECRDVLKTHSTTRVKMSGSHVGQENSKYSHFVSNSRAGVNSSSTVRFVYKTKGVISTDAKATIDPFRNFQHSMMPTDPRQVDSPTYQILGRVFFFLEHLI